jgi:hypothetical protein
MSPLRKLENSNPFFQVSLVRGLVIFYRPKKTILLKPPLGSLSVKVSGGYPIN